jgi:hypothetical protein
VTTPRSRRRSTRRRVPLPRPRVHPPQPSHRPSAAPSGTPAVQPLRRRCAPRAPTPTVRLNRGMKGARKRPAATA